MVGLEGVEVGALFHIVANFVAVQIWYNYADSNPEEIRK